jgi:hypothetical protein
VAWLTSWGSTFGTVGARLRLDDRLLTDALAPLWGTNMADGGESPEIAGDIEGFDMQGLARESSK